MDGNTQAGKDTSEDKHETKRVYLSVPKNLKAPLSGLRPTGHSQPNLKLPLCGPLSFLAWLHNPRAADEQGDTMQEDKKDYLTGRVKSGVGPGLLNDEAGCPYRFS